MPTTKNTSCRPASAAPFQPLLRAAGALGVLLIGAGLLTHSAQTAGGIRDGLASCATLVIPSLLPFLIFSGMLSTTRLGEWVSRPLEPVCRWVFHLPPEAGSALLMSMIGGYPVGARTIAQLLLHKDVTTHENLRENAQNTLETLLRYGAIPIINENDSIAVDEIAYGDNDTLSAITASLVDKD